MKVLASFFMAWGMFWTVPCPVKLWDEDCYPGMLLCLPVVGLFIGTVWALAAFLLDFLGIPAMISAAFLTAVPYALNGFIHLDGYMDCADAILSRRDRETRLKILKDSHVGSFAVISLALLFLVEFAVLAEADFAGKYVLLAFVPASARVCSTAAVLSLRPMQSSSYARMFGKGVPAPAKAAAWILQVLFIVAPVFLAGRCGLFAAVSAAGAWLTMAYNIHDLGGMSGDISGSAITVGELCGLAALIML